MIPMSISMRTNYPYVYLDVYRNNVLRTPISSLIWIASRMKDFVCKGPLMYAKQDMHIVKVSVVVYWGLLIVFQQDLQIKFNF